MSLRSGKSSKKAAKAEKDDGVPNFKKEFERFHGENGVRTIMGSIGPVNNGGCRSCALALLFPLRVLTRTVTCRSGSLRASCSPCTVRMLLKSGYRHVYISRKFAIQNGFIPRDAAPGHYGYSGLVKYGFYQHDFAALLLTVHFLSDSLGKWPITVGRTRTTHSVYLSEETHFDVVLGRSFVELRQIKFDPIDPTDVVCQDTGEKIDCELVILRDGRGQIVVVT